MRAHQRGSGQGNRGPVTDGINVVYRRDTQLVLWKDGGRTAYAPTDAGGATQVRVRAPDGTDRQVTSGFTGSLIRALSAEGTLV